MSNSIGYCDHCGAMDHHLVHGLCPVCDMTALTIPIGAVDGSDAGTDYGLLAIGEEFDQ